MIAIAATGDPAAAIAIELVDGEEAVARVADRSAGLKRSATVAQGSGIRSRDQSDDELETSAEAQARLKKLLDLNAKYPWIATEGGTPIEGGDGTVQPWHVKLVLTKDYA
jgi:hypothetical protein